jgi:hypothetical protein
LLLEAGANVDYFNELGMTSLHISIYREQEHIVAALVDYGAKPSIVDCFGRSSLDWAYGREPLLKMIAPRRRPFRFTPVSEQLQVLRKSIRFLIEKAIQQNSDRFMHELGHCLIYIHDFGEARQAFRQQVHSVVATVHNASCSLCPLHNKIRGERYVCQTCPDVNLCSRCMKKYNTTRSDKWCRKHQFLQVLGGSSDRDQVTKMKLYGAKRSQWLKGLAEKYKV